jgi:hypothetical protein
MQWAIKHVPVLFKFTDTLCWKYKKEMTTSQFQLHVKINSLCVYGETPVEKKNGCSLEI